METRSLSGFRYFITLTDDHSRYCVLYFLKKKSEVAEKIQQYVKMVQTQFKRTPKAIRSDNGGEYTSEALKQFYRQNGILPQYTTSYSPQSNGVAERRNRYLIEMARCMLADAELDDRFWAEAMNTAVHLQNVLPSKSIVSTPHEIWTGRKPNMDHLRVFGCQAFVHIPKQQRKKLSPVSREMTFIGYSSDHKGWRFMDMKSLKVIISRDAHFLESAICDDRKADVDSNSTAEVEVLNYDLKSSCRNDDEACNADEEQPVGRNQYECDSDDEQQAQFESAAESSFETSSDESPNVTIHEGNRRSMRSTKGVPPLRYEVSGAVVEITNEPRSYTEAVNGSERDQWMIAMQEELTSLADNQTWEMATLPPGKSAVGSKWIYKKKTDQDGAVIRYKARLVAQGFSQRYGTDYEEVFAPVVKQSTFRVLLTIASRRKLLVKHVDVKSAYLYGELDEVIYMKPPPGLKTDPNSVCRLKKSIYGLKQAGRVWNKTLDNVLRKMTFQSCPSDPCLYRRERNGETDFIAVYVDDMVIACKSEAEFQKIMSVLKKQFKISSLGNLTFFLGMKLDKIDGCYLVSQSTYISKLASRFGLSEAKPSHIPMDPGFIQQKEERNNELPRSDDYQSLIGGLLYISVMTRPDIAIAVSILGRRVSHPTSADWIEAKRVIRYLNETKELKRHIQDTMR